jgi:uncharacterized SAM-binding protein YcdF (DUF218 family)
MTWRFLRARRYRLTAVTLCVFLLVAILLAWWLSPRYLEVSQPPEKADVIVVLDGDDGRMARAAELFEAGYAPSILFSGFHKEDIERLRAKLSIPESAVIHESMSHNTYTNATLSAPLLRKGGARTVLLVTSWYHSRRALQTFRHVMPEIRFISVPVRRGVDPRDRQYANNEFWKLCYYGLAYGVSPV